MKRFLLVNPWIYDFAAYNFGIKPLGLLRIAEMLRREGNEVSLIDCLDGAFQKKDEFGFSKIQKERVEKPYILTNIARPYFRYGIKVPEFILRMKKIKYPDQIFVTSGMTYWYPGVQFTIRLLKKYFRGVPITLGGIYATLCYKHAILTSGADRVWKGEYIDDSLFFERGFYPAYDLLKHTELLPIQLTRGCPFRCTYCASRKLRPGFELKDPVNLFEEVIYYYKKFGTKNFVFYDDALTYRSAEGIKRFLRMIIASEKDFIFHTPNGLHTRYIDEELAELLKKANFRDLRLSLETSDEYLQEFTGGKVTNNDLKRAIRNLREAGFNKDNIGVYLLIGAEWLDIEKTLQDIIFINSLGAKAILASYSPIPGTKDYYALIKKGIFKKNTDPLWHNKTIFPELLAPQFTDNIQRIRNFTSKLNKS